MLKTLLNHRQLLWELVWRDIRSRYIGSLAGLFWSLLNPLLQLGLYTVIFSLVLGQRFAEADSTGDFALYLFCGLLPWMTLQESLVRSAGIWIENAGLIKKARFPLELLPAARVISAALHQLLASLLFVAVLITTGSLNWGWLVLFPLALFVQSLLMHGLAVAGACLNVFFRDVSQFLGIGSMALFWMTPIVYPKSKAPGVFLTVLNLNPLTHMVEAYRFVLMGHPLPSPWGQLYWVGAALAALALGRWMLARTRGELLDLI